MAIRAMVIVIVVVVGRPVGRSMSWMPISSSGIRFVSLKGINQGHLVIMFIGLMRLSQKTEFKNLKSIA